MTFDNVNGRSQKYRSVVNYAQVSWIFTLKEIGYIFQLISLLHAGEPRNEPRYKQNIFCSVVIEPN